MISARYWLYGFVLLVTTAIGPPGPSLGGGGGGAAVVKDQLTGAMVLPAMSFAPDTLAVYVVDAASGEFGVNVTVRLAAS
jgi:hypothetical protein